jgi:hypothetical protein
VPGDLNVAGNSKKPLIAKWKAGVKLQVTTRSSNDGKSLQKKTPIKKASKLYVFSLSQNILKAFSSEPSNLGWRINAAPK